MSTHDDLVAALEALVEFEPTEHVPTMTSDFECVFCGQTKPDDDNATIKHDPDCLITQARAALEKARGN